MVNEEYGDSYPCTDEKECFPLSWGADNFYATNYSYLFPFEIWPYRSMEAVWLYNNWTWSVWFVSFYVLFVNYLGPKLMSYRKKGFELRTAMVVWNVGSAIFSMIGFWRSSYEILRVWSRHGFEHSVCISSYSQDSVFCFWIKMFIFSKFYELLDTVFLILRKRPVSFLHWYHHSTVLVFTWHGARTLTAAGRWFCWMNYGVHIVIYAYFAWRTSGRSAPRWVSMGVTCVQMSQMVVGIVIGYTVFQVKMAGRECHQNWPNIYMALGIYSTFLVLFVQYFYNAYVRKASTKKAVDLRGDEKKSSRDENQNQQNGANGFYQNSKADVLRNRTVFRAGHSEAG